MPVNINKLKSRQKIKHFVYTFMNSYGTETAADKTMRSEFVPKNLKLKLMEELNKSDNDRNRIEDISDMGLYIHSSCSELGYYHSITSSAIKWAIAMYVDSNEIKRIFDVIIADVGKITDSDIKFILSKYKYDQELKASGFEPTESVDSIMSIFREKEYDPTKTMLNYYGSSIWFRIMRVTMKNSINMFNGTYGNLFETREDNNSNDMENSTGDNNNGSTTNKDADLYREFINKKDSFLRMSEENNRHKLNKIISETNVEEDGDSDDYDDDNGNDDDDDNNDKNIYSNNNVDQTFNNYNVNENSNIDNIEIIENVKNDVKTNYKQNFNYNVDTDDYDDSSYASGSGNVNINKTKVNRKLIFDNNEDNIGDFEIIKKDIEKNRINIEKIKNKYEWPAVLNASNESSIVGDDGNDKLIIVNNGTGNKTPINNGNTDFDIYDIEENINEKHYTEFNDNEKDSFITTEEEGSDDYDDDDNVDKFYGRDSENNIDDKINNEIINDTYLNNQSDLILESIKNNKDAYDTLNNNLPSIKEEEYEKNLVKYKSLTNLPKIKVNNNDDDDDKDEDFLKCIESHIDSMPLLNKNVLKNKNKVDDDFLSYIEKRIDMSIGGLFHFKDSLFVNVPQRSNINIKKSGCVLKEILSDDDDINNLNIIKEIKEKDDKTFVKDDGLNNSINVDLEINGNDFEIKLNDVNNLKTELKEKYGNVEMSSNVVDLNASDVKNDCKNVDKYNKSEDSLICDKEIEDIFADCFDETSSSTTSSSIEIVDTT